MAISLPVNQMRAFLVFFSGLHGIWLKISKKILVDTHGIFCYNLQCISFEMKMTPGRELFCAFLPPRA